MYISRMSAVQQRDHEEASPVTVKTRPQTKSRPAVPSQHSSQRKTPLQLLVLALGVQGLATRASAQPLGFVPSRPGTGLHTSNTLMLLGATGVSALANAAVTEGATASPSQTPKALKAAQRRERKREQQEIIRIIDSQCHQLGPIERDNRAQNELPTKDVRRSTSEPRMTIPMIKSVLQWVKDTRPHETKNPGISQQFNIPFQLGQQRNMVNALVSASPTLTRWLGEAKKAHIKIRWGEGSGFDVDSNTITMEKIYDVDRKSLERQDLLIFQYTSHFVATLAHELAHAGDPHTRKAYPQPAGFATRAEYVKQFLSFFAKAEGAANYGRLIVAEEIFNKTGVDLSTGNASYRAGEAQSIFHSKKLTTEGKRQALEHHAFKTHGGFGPDGYYFAKANSNWDELEAFKKTNAGHPMKDRWERQEL